MRKKDDLDIIEQELGIRGKMVGSKGRYRHNNPQNLAVFNANVFLDGKVKVWHGDLDITLEVDKLRNLARRINQIVYVTYECNGRDPGNVNLEDYIVKVDERGHVTVHPDKDYIVVHDGDISLRPVERKPFDRHSAYSIKLEKDDIERVIELDVRALSPKTGAEKHCPYDKLMKIINYSCGSAIFLGPKTYRKFSEYLESWMLMKYPGYKTDEYGFNKDWCFFTLCDAHPYMNEDLEENKVYIRKERER